MTQPLVGPPGLTLRGRHNPKCYGLVDGAVGFVVKIPLNGANLFFLWNAEAMTFGLPVIAPPVGGPAEIVTHGIEGYCIDSRDGAALSRAVQKLADDPETYGAMARAARRRAQDFTFESYSIALREALGSLGKGHSE